MKLIISDKRQKLIDEKNNLPLTIGESVFVNTEAINGRKYLNKNPATKPCIIVSINDDYLIVKEEASLNNSRHEIKRSDMVSRNNRMVGANPFDENVDNITCKAYTLECILINYSTLIAPGCIVVLTNGTTPQNIFPNGVPFNFTYTAIMTISTDTTAANVIVYNNGNVVGLVAKGTTAGNIAAVAALANKSQVMGTPATVVSSNAGNAFIIIFYTAL